MTPVADAVVAVLLLTSGVLVLVAAVGLLRLPDFFTRMHAPSIASTLGTWLVALATIVHFTAHQGSVMPSAWLVAVVLSITAPVTTAFLARAAAFRRRAGGDEDAPPPLA
jgi:multicomponent K+:H+ antiporter subunit G